MEEFSVAILNQFISKGYKFVLYHNMEHFAFVVPRYQLDYVDEGSYCISIDDEQVGEMALGVEGFSFYVWSFEVAR